VLDELAGRLNSLLELVELTERELRTKRQLISRLQSERAHSPTADPLYEEAMEVLAFWRARCAPHTRELNGKRLEKALARLHGGYDRFELMRAVFGYSRKPYVIMGRRMERGLRQQWHADAELIFRDAKHVDAGIAISADYEDELRELNRTPGAGLLDALPESLF
jgi:hypothetical protein